ncbi:MAG: UPF0489 family protein [Oscillospiraceae bacterium]|jgi:hypothetical protein|nr:UPF0489 family protein [Oscillospiraceae bacterium]
MRVLDIDMDYFVREMATFIPADCKERLSDDYNVWEKGDVINFIEQKLGLSKNKKTRGRIITNHHEALFFWREKIKTNELSTPFEVLHIDSHADLGLGCSSWIFIFEKLLGIKVEERQNIESYPEIFEEFKQPQIGDYLLFALAFRWISKLTYICNPNEPGNDYICYILKDCIEPNNKIQLPFNDKYPASDLNDSYKRKNYLKTAQLEPEVDFEIIRKIENVNYDGNFDFLTFCVSPNYTPKSADFIINIIKEYIVEE